MSLDIFDINDAKAPEEPTAGSVAAHETPASGSGPIAASSAALTVVDPEPDTEADAPVAARLAAEREHPSALAEAREAQLAAHGRLHEALRAAREAQDEFAEAVRAVAALEHGTDAPDGAQVSLVQARSAQRRVAAGLGASGEAAQMLQAGRQLRRRAPVFPVGK